MIMLLTLFKVCVLWPYCCAKVLLCVHMSLGNATVIKTKWQVIIAHADQQWI